MKVVKLNSPQHFLGSLAYERKIYADQQQGHHSSFRKIETKSKQYERHKSNESMKIRKQKGVEKNLMATAAAI